MTTPTETTSAAPTATTGNTGNAVAVRSSSRSLGLQRPSQDRHGPACLVGFGGGLVGLAGPSAPEPFPDGAIPGGTHPIRSRKPL
jgi:hypothetical protein